MSPRNPTISVLMAAYNARREYLEAAACSVLDQSFGDFEFIIVDDGSEESAEAHLQEIAARDPRVRLHRLTRNVGLTQALNVGLGLARGTYVARQDADDVSLPGRFSATVGFLEKHPNLSAAGTCVVLIGPAGEVQSGARIDPDLRQLEKRNVLVHGSMMFRKCSIDQVGGYDARMRLSQDYEIYLRMIRLHGMQLGIVPEALYALRQHADSLSSRRMFGQLYFSALAKTLTLPYSGPWRRRLAFVKTFAVDLFLTHRLLLGPIFRRGFMS